MGKGKVLAAKLLLEGIEVPFIGATITHTVNTASIAYIDLVPHKSINNIKPRTLVQLFVRNFMSTEDSPPFILAWEGEVFGYNFGKTTSSRTFTINCTDKSSYWDNCISYFFNAQQSLGKDGINLDNGQEIVDAHKQKLAVNSVSYGTTSLYLQTIRKTLEDKSKDFLDAFVAIYKKFAGVNGFYEMAEDRLRIIDRIRLKSSGDIQSLMKNDEAQKWLEGITGGINGYATLRTVIQDVMSLIFHDYISVPFPAKVESTNLNRPGIKMGSKQGTIGEFVFKPNIYMLPPPVCNIFFPDEYSQFQFSRNFFLEPTRLIYKPEMPQGLPASKIALKNSYQPESFNNFMRGTESAKEDGVFSTEDGLMVNEEFGHFGEDNPEFKDNSEKKKEQHFLTNEEKMRGIFIAQEQMLPSSAMFRTSFSDFGKRSLISQISQYLFFKKRFQSRSLQITSHLKMSVVPGFPVLILDDSDADQNVIAYCSSVTHRVYADQGGYTNVSLSYARGVNEQDTASLRGGSLLIPPWFSKDLFGETGNTTESADAGAKEELADAGRTIMYSKEISTFYKALLGNKGSQAVTDYKGEKTLIGAVRTLLSEYRKFKEAGGTESVQSFISKVTNRDYTTMTETMAFLGAYTQTTDLSTQFVEYFGKRLSGTDGSPDNDTIKTRRSVIKSYRDALKSARGFRG